MSYEEAVKQLKVLEKYQRTTKKYRKSAGRFTKMSMQRDLHLKTKEINMLLSLISAHKQARRMYGILKDVQDKLGLSTKERKLVDGVLNEKK